MSEQLDDGAGEQLLDELSYTEKPPPGALAGDDDERVAVEETDAIAAAEAQWEVEATGQILKGVGLTLHELLGAGETDWKMSEGDLERIAPPLTRILNRYERTRAMADFSDPMLLGYGVFRYAARSTLQMRAAQQLRREEEEEQYVAPDVAEPEAPTAPQSAPSQPTNGLRFPEASRRRT